MIIKAVNKDKVILYGVSVRRWTETYIFLHFLVRKTKAKKLKATGKNLEVQNKLLKFFLKIGLISIHLVND